MNWSSTPKYVLRTSRFSFMCDEAPAGQAVPIVPWSDTFVFPEAIGMTVNGTAVIAVDSGVGRNCSGVKGTVPMCYGYSGTVCDNLLSGVASTADVLFDESNIDFRYMGTAVFTDTTFGNSTSIGQGQPSLEFVLCRKLVASPGLSPTGVAMLSSGMDLIHFDVQHYNTTGTVHFNVTGRADGAYRVEFAAIVQGSTSVFSIGVPCERFVVDVLKANADGVYTSFVRDNADGTGFEALRTGEPDDCSVSITIADNGRGDEDAIRGMITDPLDVVYSNLPVVSTTTGDSGTSNSFIVYALIPTIFFVTAAMLYLLLYMYGCSLPCNIAVPDGYSRV